MSQFVFIRISKDLDPLERHEKYGDPLDEALQNECVGEVTGGGSVSPLDKEEGLSDMACSGLDVELDDFERGLPILRMEIKRLNFPPGTVLIYTRDEIRRVEPIT